ncbi:cell division ATP-binding protein FtsE [Geoalkalibacter subterraneus]|uniref:Cell division ATP-binding protein FtsE n=1 Tax=Geoalkalibacter subterraneus TaxID=483547 RepID=A0A0B5FQ51_9BACT|nr:cell division ATP-binding protein FtsE [Geoalkalibacter subterraneus]AJF06210.1 cell division protein FtsE [Geoalkalibacter subterraneus]
MIQIYNVCKNYSKDSAALDQITLKIPKGDFVFITGPSGAGKSTLLKLLYAGERPNRGQILIDGRNVTRMSGRQVPFLRRKMGVVFQDFKLIAGRTIYENVAFALEVQGRKRYEISKKVYAALKNVGLEHKLNRYPLELSGGEQQRVAVARALVVDPMILIADEPTGNLDPETTIELMELFKSANARGSTVLMATHDRDLIRRYPRRIVTLENGRLTEDREV